jgi:hypothetical protein
MRTARIALVLASMLALAACGEKPQGGSVADKGGAPAWQGTNDGFVAEGWKAGDKAAWDKQMTTRSQGQNEYVRMGGAS